MLFSIAAEDKVIRLAQQRNPFKGMVELISRICIADDLEN